MPLNNSPLAGALTMPNKGEPFSIKATFTVKSPFLSKNSFVPSKGSINQKVSSSSLCFGLSSSESMEKFKPRLFSPSTKILCEIRSASVKGDPSSFFSRVISLLVYISIMLWEAFKAISETLSDSSSNFSLSINIYL